MHASGRSGTVTTFAAADAFDVGGCESLCEMYGENTCDEEGCETHGCSPTRASAGCDGDGLRRQGRIRQKRENEERERDDGECEGVGVAREVAVDTAGKEKNVRSEQSKIMMVMGKG